ncbi:MAG: group 1 truncated hemoglobin [Candidatus Promineifilaceae bacterium]|nr:group 1 truncated hemoglobin [Candidatus Promineifilaceae bacterium]
MRGSIFERYGGMAKVSRIVLSFYNKMLDSPLTAPYFANTDMRRLIDHQTKFIASIMGGPASYSNSHLERVHEHLGITEEAFMESMTMLAETLEDHNFAEDDIRRVEGAMMGRKNYIVARRES